MKNIGTVILIAVILLAVFAIVLFLGPLAQKPGMREPEVAVSSAETPAQRPRNAEPKREVASHRAERSGEEERSGATGESASASTPQPQSAVPAKPAPAFPVAADIPIGMQKSRLETTYGKPNMITTVVDRGSLIETLVYLRREPNTATVVLVKSGRVVGANTTVY